MKLFNTVLLAASLTVAASQTFAQKYNDSVLTVNRAVNDFNSIRIQGDFEVYLTQGNDESVKIEATDEQLSNIITGVSGRELNIKNSIAIWPWKDGSWWKTHQWFNNNNGNWNERKMLVYITAKNIERISISGSGHIIFKDGVTADELTLRVRGSGHLDGKVTVKKLYGSISGNGNINVNGTAEMSKVHISGSGDFAGLNLITESSTVHVSGSGHADINASKEVSASVSGSAHVGYTGSANKVSTSHSGSGRVSKI